MSELTGRTRYRHSFWGKIIVQVEVILPQKGGGAYLAP